MSRKIAIVYSYVDELCQFLIAFMAFWVDLCLKPNCRPEMLATVCSCSLLTITPSSTLAREVSNLIGLNDFGCAGSLYGAFLITTISAFFHGSGKIPEVRRSLMRDRRGDFMMNQATKHPEGDSVHTWGLVRSRYPDSRF